MRDTLRFDHLRSTYQRAQRVRLVILHWTGGRKGAASIYHTLRNTVGPKTPDGLSVHYTIDSAGVVVQHCALERACLHAGFVNPCSVGIEVACPGFPGDVSAIEFAEGIERREYHAVVHGRGLTLCDYTEAQHASVAVLVEELCAKLHVPRRVPTDSAGRVLARKLTDDEISGFAGVIGHLHVHPTKCDPGTAPLERLRARWAENSSR